MPIIDPSEYQALKNAGKIRLTQNVADPTKIDIAIDRGELETMNKAAILSWLDDQITESQALTALLQSIRTDVENVG